MSTDCRMIARAGLFALALSSAALPAHAQERSIGRVGAFEMGISIENGRLHRCYAKRLNTERQDLRIRRNFGEQKLQVSMPKPPGAGADFTAAYQFSRNGTVYRSTFKNITTERIFITLADAAESDLYASKEDFYIEFASGEHMSWPLDGVEPAIIALHDCISTDGRRASADPNPPALPPVAVAPAPPQPQGPQASRFAFANVGPWSIWRLSDNPSGNPTRGCTIEGRQAPLSDLRLATDGRLAIIEWRDGTDMRAYPKSFPVQVAFGTGRPFRNYTATIHRDDGVTPWARISERANADVGIERSDQIVVRSQFGTTTFPMYDRDQMFKQFVRCAQMIR
jgi:hypothetical protein